MSQLFLNNSRNGWWNIGTYSYMYAEITGVFEYGRQYADSVEFTFTNFISPRGGTTITYNASINAQLYINGALKHTFTNLKPTTSGDIANQPYEDVIGIIIDGLAPTDTSATWRMVYTDSSGYTCEASGVLSFDAYDDGTEYIDVTYTGAWYDNNNACEIRPDVITIHLYADNVYENSHVISNPGNGGKFTVPRYNDSGTEIAYALVVNPVESYFVSVFENPSIENHWHIDLYPLMSTTGTIVWDDDNNADGLRPSTYKVSLKRDGVVVDTKEISSSTTTFTFDNQKIYNMSSVSNAHHYSLPLFTYDIEDIGGYSEEYIAVGNYCGIINDFTITLSHPEKKEWINHCSYVAGTDGVFTKRYIAYVYKNGEFVRHTWNVYTTI